MMCSYFKLTVLVLVALCAKVECRDPINLALIPSPKSSNWTLCAMVDHQTLSRLSPNPKEAKTYELQPILKVDGCYAIPPDKKVAGKMVVELSNLCAIRRQMEVAMMAGASGLMLIISNNVSRYPFKMDLQKPSNVTFPIVVLTQVMYRALLRSRFPMTDNISIQLVGRPKSPKLSFGFIAFHIIAFICLLSGGYLSLHGLNGLKFSPIFGVPQQRYNGRVYHLTGYRHQTSNLSPIQTAVSLFVFGALTVGSLLLLYFYYDIFVYVIIFFVSIVFTVSLKSQLMEVICRLPKLKDMDQQIVITRKCLKMWLGPEIDVRSIVIFPFCVIPPVLLFVFRKDLNVVWIIQDILGILACSYVIKILRFGNLKLITVICCAFFVYDIFMVYITPLFKQQAPEKGYNRISNPLWEEAARRTKRSSGNSIMEDVATGNAGKSGEKLPIMFIFPFMNIYAQTVKLPCVTHQFSILGFGDIVVPGILVAFAFMVDSRLKNVASRCCRCIYAPLIIAGYHIGLILVFVLLLIMKTGQPALITLIPFTLIPFIVCAAIRGELRMIWNGTFPSMPVEVLEEDDNVNIGGLNNANE